MSLINGTGGLVETITFRTISLRDFSGVVHIFPNGAINTLSNMTKEWSASSSWTCASPTRRILTGSWR